MKITALPEIFRFTNRVQEKQDGQSPGGQDHGKKEDPPKKEERQATPEEVGQAVALFHVDPRAKEAGLTAEATGAGPGLRVVLRDGQGAVVRQFTGEEFLKLREAAAGDPRMRGKILDQKF